MTDKPVSARSLAGSFALAPTIAALRWLLEGGFAASGTSRTGGTRREPVYWLTGDGVDLYRNILCSNPSENGCQQSQ